MSRLVLILGIVAGVCQRCLTILIERIDPVSIVLEDGRQFEPGSSFLRVDRKRLLELGNGSGMVSRSLQSLRIEVVCAPVTRLEIFGAFELL